MEIDIQVKNKSTDELWMMQGIFRLERGETKDRMTWCFAMPDKPRPQNFSIKRESNHKLIELDRFDETKALEAIRSSKGLTFKATENWIEKVVLDSPTPEAITALGSLLRLKTLTLGIVDDGVVERFDTHPNLRQLRLETNLTPPALDKLLRKMPKLEKLDFPCAQFTTEYAKALSNSKSLSTICLSGNNGFYDGFEELENSSVHTIHISSSQFPISNVSRIGASLPTLESMNFYGCDVSIDRLASVRELDHIKKISLVHCRIEDETCEHLSKLPKLERLEINYKSWLRRRAIREKKQNNPIFAEMQKSDSPLQQLRKKLGKKN